MRQTGIVELPLHSGRCPKWLFPMMRELSGKISEVIINEYGEEEFLRRISDPYWFQALGCVIGFDWHSSGLTTTTCGALKESLNKSYIGIGVAGGKGKTSRKAIEEIKEIGNRLNINEKRINNMVKASRLSAKVDNSLVQDNYQLYHHSFFFSRRQWAVVQQGMNNSIYARRYHWLSLKVERFVQEPHSGIISDNINKDVLNLTAKEVEQTRRCSVDLVKDNPKHLMKYLGKEKNNSQRKLFEFDAKSFVMSIKHFPKIDADMKVLLSAYEQQPKNYEELILVKRMGAKNLRALALISHLIYGNELIWKDPCKFSFAHGGKDGWPYFVKEKRFKNSFLFLRDALKEVKIGDKYKLRALRRLNNFYQSLVTVSPHRNSK